MPWPSCCTAPCSPSVRASSLWACCSTRWHTSASSSQAPSSSAWRAGLLRPCCSSTRTCTRWRPPRRALWSSSPSWLTPCRNIWPSPASCPSSSVASSWRTTPSQTCRSAGRRRCRTSSAHSPRWRRPSCLSTWAPRSSCSGRSGATSRSHWSFCWRCWARARSKCTRSRLRSTRSGCPRGASRARTSSCSGLRACEGPSPSR
mmetsp:Transcript_3883/g.12143  ORF Transcript_3883/g.12143 Transcript_3883/m.12143 type:complete len:203 (-) Transcript_3883:632-1240(-)